MKKIFTIDVSGYPTTYTIEAENESEAKEKAKEWYSNQFNGRSVYESVVTDVEEVE